jgi:hypothetical protein
MKRILDEEETERKSVFLCKKRKKALLIRISTEKIFNDWIELLLLLKEFIFENLSIESNFHFLR